MVKRVWINNEPFQFIEELHTKMHEGYQPTQEDFDEVARLMNIVLDAIRPVVDEWIEAMVSFFNYINELLETMEPEIREKLEMYGKPIVTPEAGVEQKEPEPEEPMGHPHMSYGPNIQYVYIPPDYRPYYNFRPNAEETIADVSRRLDRGTES